MDFIKELTKALTIAGQRSNISIEQIQKVMEHLVDNNVIDYESLVKFNHKHRPKRNKR